MALWFSKMALHLYFLHIAELIVFAFSDSLSAENSKLSAESGLQRLQLLECMFSLPPHPILGNIYL